MKKILLICLLALGACSTSKVQPKPLDEFPLPTTDVSQVDSKDYWINNNLTITSEEIKDGIVLIQSLIISGMKDKAVETKINQAIADKITEIRRVEDKAYLPKYSGFFVRYPYDLIEVTSVNISAYSSFNSNNILSIQFNTSVEFTYGSERTMYSFMMDGLNFDLVSGNKLNLSDLFINGSDFETLINTSMSKDIAKHVDETDSFYSSYQLIGQFKGISPSQSYFITDYGLNFILDETTPAFYTYDCSTTINIPFSDLKSILAMDQRFIKDTSLTEDNAIHKQFKLVSFHTANTYDKTTDTIPVKVSTYLPDDLSTSEKAIIDAYQEEQYALLLEDNLNASSQYAFFQIVVNRVGRYLSVSAYSNVDQGEANYYFNGDSRSLKADGSKVTLDDIFVSGFDYEGMIKREITEYLTSSELSSVITVDEVYQHLQWSIYYSSIELSSEFDLINGQAFYASISFADYPNAIKVFD